MKKPWEKLPEKRLLNKTRSSNLEHPLKKKKRITLPP